MDRSSVTRRLDSGLSRICTSNFKTCAALQAPHDRSPIRRGGTPLINPEENRDSSSSKSYSFLVSLPLGNMGVMVGIPRKTALYPSVPPHGTTTAADERQSS